MASNTMLHVCPARISESSGHFVYHVGDVDSVTDLGVNYDNRLTFRFHIDKIVSKAALRAKLILKCFQSRDSALLTKAFCTFIRPVLEYCCVILDSRVQARHRQD